MQTPHRLRASWPTAASWRPTGWQVIFNRRRFPPRLAHMVLAAYLTTALVVGAASAWRLLQAAATRRESRIALRMAIGMFAVVAPAAAASSATCSGEVDARAPAGQAGRHRGASGRPAPTSRFHVARLARPRRREATAGRSPSPGSAAGSPPATPTPRSQGLKAFAPRGPAAGRSSSSGPSGSWSGWAWLMIGLGAVGRLLIWRRRRSERSRLFLRACVAMGPAGFVAVIAGWIVAEVGRQPWVVYGVLRTARRRLAGRRRRRSRRLAAGLHGGLRGRVQRRAPSTSCG